MERVRRRLSYANVVATLALVVAVAGVPAAVAVTSAAKKSDVNKKGNIRTGRVTAAKLADGAVTAGKLDQIQVVQQTAAGGGSASCPVGARLLSGGGSAPSGNLNATFPRGNEWVVSAPGGEVTVYALCLNS